MAANRVSPITHVGIALGVLLLLLAGLWVAAGLIAPTYATSIAFGVGWFVVASLALGKAVKNRPGLRWTVRGTFLTTAVVVGAWFAWTSLRDETVNEDVITAAPAAEAAAKPDRGDSKPAGAAPAKANVELSKGQFQAADEGDAGGLATLIRKAEGGRVLTLTDLDVANGPDLRVYLVPGDGTDTSDNIDLGGLKGNKGNQQYDVPGDADTGKYRTVVIWCRAFSVAFARAPLG